MAKKAKGPHVRYTTTDGITCDYLFNPMAPDLTAAFNAFIQVFVNGLKAKLTYTTRKGEEKTVTVFGG